TIRTHEACLRIIDKRGPLDNPADRDHCIQYMVSVALLSGRLTADDYEDAVAADPRIDALRAKIACVEDPAFTRDYHDPDKRSIANGLTLEFDDGLVLDEVLVEYPLGHRRRRAEGIPLLETKFRASLARRFAPGRQQAILDASLDHVRLLAMPVHEYVDLYVSQLLCALAAAAHGVRPKPCDTAPGRTARRPSTSKERSPAGRALRPSEAGFEGRQWRRSVRAKRPGRALLEQSPAP